MHSQKTRVDPTRVVKPRSSPESHTGRGGSLPAAPAGGGETKEKEAQGRAERADEAEPDGGRRQRGSSQQVGGGQYSVL